MTDEGFRPCPACPDGYRWTANGPTGATCPVCRGFAAVHLDGRPLTKAEFYREEVLTGDCE